VLHAGFVVLLLPRVWRPPCGRHARVCESVIRRTHQICDYRSVRV